MRKTVLVFAFALQSFARAAESQPASGIVGRVLNESGARVADANVEVEGTALRVTTRKDGTFELPLQAGDFRLLVRRIGFTRAAVAVHITVGESRRDTLTVRLATAPTELRSIVVSQQQQAPMSATITTETIRQAPPLAEPDVFRLLVLLPAVSQPNDLLSRVHFAGGASDEHAITLDGHPLQSPFHVNSVLGAFNVAALDRADVLMHFLPSAQDGHLSGEIALMTKHPEIERSRELVVSLASASATLTQPSIVGFDVLVSARASYLDKLLHQYSQRVGTSDDTQLPGFRDLLLRVDRDWKQNWTSSIVSFSTRDAWPVTVNATHAGEPKWGENLLGLKLVFRGNNWEWSGNLSTDNTFASRAASISEVETADSLRRNQVQVTQRWRTGSLTGQYTSRNWRSSFGASIAARDHRHQWSGQGVFGLFRSAVPSTFDARVQQNVVGLFGETSYVPGIRWRTTVGAHMSTVAGNTFVAPRFLVSLTPATVLQIDLSLNRRYQFDAIASEPDAGSITQPVFLLNMPRRADVMALSAEWRPKPKTRGLQFTANFSAYVRKYRNQTIRDTLLRAPSSLSNTTVASATSDVDQGSLFLRASGTIVGATATTDVRIPNGIAFRASYTRQRARQALNGIALPVAWDAPHQLSAFASLPLRTRLSLTTTAQMHSGPAATPVNLRLLAPSADGRFHPVFFYGDPLTSRTPGYSRVDVGMRYGWHALNAAWVLSLQAINVFAKTNGLDYDVGQYALCVNSTFKCEYDGARKRSLPVLPSIGLEVKW
ncbi:MAG: TonB-dependent receptor [Gemmatimonadaceae bacterium]